MSQPQFPVTRYAGSPDSNPADWLRINHLTHQPGPGSAYKITIEPIAPVEEEVPVDLMTDGEWYAGFTKKDWIRATLFDISRRIQNGTAAIGATREEALANLKKAKARGPL